MGAEDCGQERAVFPATRQPSTSLRERPVHRATVRVSQDDVLHAVSAASGQPCTRHQVRKLTQLLQQRVGVTDQQLQKEQWIRALFFLPLRHGGVGLTSAVNTRHAAFLAAVLNGLDPLPSGLKAQALQALEKCLEQATKNSQLSELLLKACGTEDPIDTLLNELRSKDGSFVESRGFQKRLCAAIAKQDRDDMTQTLNRASKCG